MKYYIIAGEPSGDLHGANLMREIKHLDPNAEFRFWGGDDMLAIDKNLEVHIKETSVMGFVEVMKQLPKFRALFKQTQQSILDFQPDQVIFIDYPGFNLRMAKWVKKQGIRTVYYISPQLWAWKKGRIETVKSYVDKMIVILPFEKSFYKDHNVNVTYVGHPLLPVIESYRKKHKPLRQDKKILALLPGSRKQEIQKVLPSLLGATEALQHEYEIRIAIAPHQELSFYRSLLGEHSSYIHLDTEGSYSLLNRADLALVASGTATLETALFEVPQIVCYKTSSINYWIGKQMIDLPYISLVNLIAEEEIVTELIQDDLNTEKILEEVARLTKDHQKILAGYKFLKGRLTIEENPSALAASVVCSN